MVLTLAAFITALAGLLALWVATWRPAAPARTEAEVDAHGLAVAEWRRDVHDGTR